LEFWYEEGCALYNKRGSSFLKKTREAKKEAGKYGIYLIMQKD
jgi:hypothetical protein